MGRARRCFGSNYRIDPEAVMDDLIQTLDRMQIKPIGRESVNRSFSEHRVIPPVADTSEEAAATHAGGAISVAALRADLDTSMNGAEEEYRLVRGDRVVVRYLDVEPSRPEFFTMSDIADDPMNGYLLLSSPLGQALSQGSPGDELSFQDGGRILFVSLETVSAQAAQLKFGVSSTRNQRAQCDVLGGCNLVDARVQMTGIARAISRRPRPDKQSGMPTLTRQRFLAVAWITVRGSARLFLPSGLIIIHAD